MEIYLTVASIEYFILMSSFVLFSSLEHLIVDVKVEEEKTNNNTLFCVP